MIITNQYGSVCLNIPFNRYKKIGISFSGGADSTLMLYYLLRHFRNAKPDAIIVPITGITVNKGMFKQFKSQEILDLFLNHYYPDIAPKVMERKIWHGYEQVDYGNWTRELQKDGVVDLMMYGLNRNPPADIRKIYDLDRDRELLRDEQAPMWRGNTFEPFRNVDKRFMAQCYRDEKIWDIAEMTVSCERLREEHDLDEKPCGMCWWCREKMMAFNMYDGGLKFGDTISDCSV